MGAQPATAAAAGSGVKSIILFSDGTGNSSGKLFKTNVWRMYEAIDLGPPSPGKRHQISYYDDGVGTSAFKPLAMLGGAFGYGLKRNVLDIYRYACRNYRFGPGQLPGANPKGLGDHIYGFGFSRGAFTMRLAIALIASQGLVASKDEAELKRRSSEAYREFRKDFLPRIWKGPTRLVRRVRRRVADWRRPENEPPYRREDNYHPVIRFVGVWDTVSAYGGPIAELTRAIDNWIYALSMPDYQLSDRVRCARHALALDDERDAFHPLLWDEVHEAGLIKTGKVKADRLQQVWFTGMHADVGGGYPDESLSYVSLLWMMEEAEKAGLRTLKVIKDRYVALANSYGPLHDSRAGAGAYYRYQPRKIAAWADPVDESTLSLRDPIIVDDQRQPRGLLCSVRVHESVIARAAKGTDRYAPITLPQTFQIVPPQVEGETKPQADNKNPTPPPKPKKPTRMISPDLRRRLLHPKVAKARADALESVWNLVWRRRVAYFITLALTLLLVFMPLWVDNFFDPPLLGDGRTWIGGLIRLLTMFLPEFMDGWVGIYADNAFYFLVLVAAIVFMLQYSTGLERRLRDRARRIWQEATALPDTRDAAWDPGTTPPPPAAKRPSKLQRFRNAPAYQRRMQRFKWTFLPNFVFWPIMALAGLWLFLGICTQAALPWLEDGTAFCPGSASAPPPLTISRFDFTTRDTCEPVGASVVRGQRYVVTVQVVDEWKDGHHSTSPEGLAAADLPWLSGYIGVPFRRVVDAKYLQPVIEIRPQDRRWRMDNVHIYPLELTQQGDRSSLYRGEFKAEKDGELSLFVNDAVSLADVDFFYSHAGTRWTPRALNSGTACVTIERSDYAGEALGAPASAICAAAATAPALGKKTASPATEALAPKR